MYKGIELGERKVQPRADMEPELGGYWKPNKEKGTRNTMSEQGCQLSIFSLQIEMEPEVREHLAITSEF